METRGDGARYRVRQKLFTVGDDYWVEDADGHKAFKVNGKAMRFHKTFILESPSGDELFKITDKKLTVHDTMKVERDGETAATVTKALISPARDRFTIAIEGGADLHAEGSFLDHEYTIERDGNRVAEISRRWFKPLDTYGLKVAAGENDALLLAAAVCIEEMAHHH